MQSSVNKSIRNNSVIKTLYLPLLGNIYASKHFRELIYDSKALELEASIPVEIDLKTIAKAQSEYSYLASATRYYNMDLEIKDFIKRHSNCNIINIGAGLDTSYFRINNTNAIFYEIDLDSVIEERKKLFFKQRNQINISSSFLDINTWIQYIQDRALPTLFIASGLFYFFSRTQIQDFLCEVREKFNYLELVFDCNSKKALSISNTYLQKTGNFDAEMYFYINEIEEFLSETHKDISLIKEYMMFTHSKKILADKISLKTKIRMYKSDFFKRIKMEHLLLKS